MRGAPVPLDQSPGDGDRVRAWEGAPGEVGAALAERAADPALDADATARLALAERLLGLLPPAPRLALWIDLRPAAAGAAERPPERDGTRVVRLPWLVIQAGAHEAVVIRAAAIKKGLRFRGGQAGPAPGPALDELSLRGPAGVARRPLRVPATLEALPAPHPAAPWPAHLPATAPGEPGAGNPLLALAQGLVAALLLLGLGLGIERAGATPPTPEPRAWELLRALEHPQAEVRRQAVLEAPAGLPVAAALRRVAEGDDAELASLALEKLALRGELGATCLGLVHASPTAAQASRLQALRLLRAAGDPRATDRARRGLASGRGAAWERRAWAEAVAEDGEPEQLQALLGHTDRVVRAAAGRGLLARLGPVAVPSVVPALLAPSPGREAEAAQVELARALARNLTDPELEALRGAEGLCPAARAVLRRHE